MAELTIEVRHQDDITILDLAGEIDINSAPALRERLESALEGGIVVLNLARVPFIDSTGLGTLVAVWNRTGNRDKAIRLCGVDETVQRTFQVTGLTKVFPIYSEEAIALSG